MMLCECGNANDLKFHHDGSCMECGATPVASPGSLLGDLLSACRELLDQRDKEENKQLAKNSSHSRRCRMNEYRVPSRELIAALEDLETFGSEPKVTREQAIRLTMEVNDLSKRITSLLTKIAELSDKEELI